MAFPQHNSLIQKNITDESGNLSRFCSSLPEKVYFLHHEMPFGCFLQSPFLSRRFMESNYSTVNACSYILVMKPPCNGKSVHSIDYPVIVSPSSTLSRTTDSNLLQV